MTAIILAGGFGTRLSHIVKDVPKPMADVSGYPFLKHIMDNLISNGINKIILSIGYKKDCIISFFGSHYKGVPVLYSAENTPLYTGGAIKLACASYAVNEDVLILNGDTYFDVNIKDMFNFHTSHVSDITVAVKEMSNFDRYGSVICNVASIIEFKEKVFIKSGFINGGVYIVNPKIFANISKNIFSFEQEVLEPLIFRTYAYHSSGYFIDIGTESDYYKSQLDFKITKNKALFLDRDGTINIDTGHLYKIEDFKFVSGVPELIKKYSDKDYKIIVLTNQAGIAKGYYSEDDMHILHDYINTMLIPYDTKIDAFYFCPHHPDYADLCTCRKPATGMLEEAIRDFNIDITASILVGDKPSDIECGQKIGVESKYINEVITC